MAEIDPSQSTLSPNFAPYVYNMLSKGEAAANLPYQAYTGERFAGPSTLQTNAFTGFQNLATPTQFGTATNMAQQAGAAQTPYTGTQFSNQFQAPGAYTAGQFNTGLGALGSVQDYMNPYMSAVTDVEAREARRQADISRQSEQARLAQAGAFGGSRQAIMEAERQRNLGTQIGDITSKGLQSAYDRALAQRAQESQLGLTAQQYGEQSRQFGATQGMNAAQLAAQYGLEAQRGTEQSRQFGANYGLQGLQQQLAAARGLSDIGAQQSRTGLENLQAQLSAGATQQQLNQQPLDFGYQQFQESMKYPYQQATYMQSLLQGLPLEATKFQPEQSSLAAAMQGILGALGLIRGIEG